MRSAIAVEDNLLNAAPEKHMEAAALELTSAGGAANGRVREQLRAAI